MFNRFILLAHAAAVTLLAGSSVAAPQDSPSGEQLRVLVQTAPGESLGVAGAVVALGGRVDVGYHSRDALIVSMPEPALSLLERYSHVHTVTPVSKGLPVSYCSSPAVAIPDSDNAGITDTISIPATDGGDVGDLNVSVRIDHTFVGDLVIDLGKPAVGASVQLMQRPGKGNNNPSKGGCSEDNIDVTFDDDSLIDVQVQCDAGGLAVSGTVNPDGMLAAFNGQDLPGDWELKVVDRAAGNTGALQEWCLFPTPATVLDAAPDTFAGAANADLSDSVASNDTGPGTYSINTEPTNGLVTLNPDGSFLYTPDQDYIGADSFTYDVTDGSETITDVLVDIEIVDNPPVAADDSFSVDSNSVLNDSVATNDSDGDGNVQPMSYSEVTGPANGALVLNADGSFSYTPAADFTGADAFTYQLSDSLSTETATVAITVNNLAPIAVADSFDGVANVDLSGDVSSNDSDPESETLSYSVNTAPASGSLTLNPDGSFVFAPAANFTGVVNFSYNVGDGTNVVSGTGVTLNISNNAPVANDDSFTVSAETPLNGNVAGNDNDGDGGVQALTFTEVTPPLSGTLDLEADGSFLYTPQALFVGIDTFTYMVSDGVASATALVTINVSPNAPRAVPDAFSGVSGVSLSGDVSLNDSDPQDDPLSYTVSTEPTNGTLDMDEFGAFVYIPNPGFVGIDGFIYAVSDGSETVQAPVSLTITNNAPTAGNDSYTVEMGDTLIADVSINDSDGDGGLQTLTYSVLINPATGSLNLNADGSFSYMPNGDFTGLDGFTYSVSDGAASVSAVVDIAVVNEAPDVTDDSFSGVAGTLISGDVSLNDSDPQDDPLDFQVSSGPSNGVLDLNADGSFDYTPNAGFTGADSFAYQVSDGLNIVLGNVELTVTNNAPVATDDEYAVQQDTALNDDVSSNDNDGDGGLQGLNFSIVSGTSNGDLTLNPNGSFSYVPNAGYFGADAFTYEIDDGVATAQATASINVIEVSESALTVGDESFYVDLGAILSDSVAGNDSDVNGDPITYSLILGPALGDLVFNEDGTFTYTAPESGTTAVSFEYLVSNGIDDAVGVATIRVGDLLLKTSFED